MKINYLLQVVALTIGLAPVSILQAQVASASSETRTENGHTVQRWKNFTGISNFNIEVRGKIEVTDDDKDIKNLSNDGYLEITKTVFGSKRSIVIESLGAGKFSKEYSEGRTKMAWDPNGKAWLGEILPEIVKSTTLGADARVNRIYAKGGTSAMLTELHALQGDYVTAHYAKLLLEKDIPASDMPSVIKTISDLVTSDYYLSTVLQQNISKMFVTPEAADAFYQGTLKINSDYYKSVVLKEALKKFPASPKQVKMILQSAGTINSDYYLSAVLTSLLEEDEMKEESLTDLINTSKKIPSDYYRTQVLSKALDKKGVSKSGLKAVVDALLGVGSDYYKTGVVINMSDNNTIEPDVQLQVIALINNSVGSDYYAAAALKSIVSNQKLSDESFKQLVNAGGKLGSSNYASEVLKKASQRTLSKSQLADILEASHSINSDYYLSEVLLSVSSQVRSADASVKEAYRQAAKKINSESYYGKALKAID
ncbi:MAG: hypothetical protein ABJA70_04335 [Chryseolinea sp.]